MNGGNPSSKTDGEKLRALGYLAAAVSHHLINAFSAIVSNAELIRSRDGAAADPTEIDTMSTAVVETAIDASQVARRLIDWARRASSVEGDAAAQKSSAVDVNQLIGNLVESEKSLASSQVEWVVTLGLIPPIAGDAGGLTAMLGFLVQNAREALPDGAGTIEISTYTDPRNWLVVAIRDTGCGMSPEVLKRATEPFFSTKPEHSGVGLTIAQAIWRRNRGALSIESRALVPSYSSASGSTVDSRMNLPNIAGRNQCLTRRDDMVIS
jgi:two-component system, NtrC family, sensor kinase